MLGPDTGPTEGAVSIPAAEPISNVQKVRPQSIDFEQAIGEASAVPLLPLEASAGSAGAALDAILDGTEKITRQLLDTVDLDHAAQTSLGSAGRSAPSGSTRT